MQVGTKVYCSSEALGLQNVEGYVSRTNLLGCDGVHVTLNDGKEVAFFGDNVKNVSITPPETNVVTSSTTTASTTTTPTFTPATTSPALTKKRVTKKKITSS